MADTKIEYRGKKWFVYGNPWVWIPEFKRVTRKEVMPNVCNQKNR